MILQHPQEPGQNLGTARIAHISLQNSQLKTGLSWKNLRVALGLEGGEVKPSRWAVLYLGSGFKGPIGNLPKTPGLYYVSRKGYAIESGTPGPNVDGFVILDGTWSQAKTLWWRNAWLLKLKRAILIPSHPSLYGSLRKEPRKECLSTIETIAECLTAQGETTEASENLRTIFAQFLQKQRNRLKTP